MARITIEHAGILRILAHIHIAKNDGSLTLSLVRSGMNKFGFQSNVETLDFERVEYPNDLPKTKKITIHASGRINYHGFQTSFTTYVPCLLDLVEDSPIIFYTVPDFESLDPAGDLRADDDVIRPPAETEAPCGFTFSVIPSNCPRVSGEIWRCIVEKRYGLNCTFTPDSLMPPKRGVPSGAFTHLIPDQILQQQSLSEEMAFLRFQTLKQENQIRESLMLAAVPVTEHVRIIDELVARGRGIQGPNGEGVWEIVTQVPMRIRPRLEVKFADPRFRAEFIKEMRKDIRLEKVRVRFEVFDKHTGKRIKHKVEILGVALDAEL